jgi:hypothetical protein
MIALAGLLDIGGKRQVLGLDSGVFYRECETCKTSKPSKKFRLRTGSKVHSRRPFCLVCEKNKRNSNYKENKTARLQKIKQYRVENWQMKMLWQAKATATRKNIAFDLDESDIVIPTHCKYLGVPLTQSLGKGVVWSNTSLDRINPALGYVKGNVEVISRKANSMKNMATVEELCVFAKNILAIHGE